MQKNKVIKRCIAGILVLMVAGGSYFTYGYFKSEQNEMPAFNEGQLTERVKKDSIKETITASGTVYLADEHEIYAEGETNIVKEFLVEEGDYVEEGQLLVNYDVEDTKEDLESKIKETEINLENERMNLKSIALPVSESERIALENSVVQAEKLVYDAKVNVENYETKISQQQTALSNAQRNIDNAKNDYEKAQKAVSDNAALLEVGAVTQSEYDDSVEACKKASDSYDDAVQEYNDIADAMEEIEKSRVSDEYALKNAEVSLKEAQNKLKNADNVFSDEGTELKYKQQQNQIKLTEISLSDSKKKLSDLVYSTTSPVSGLVTEICIDEGTYTEENTVMLKIADFNKLIVKASIAEYDAPNIELGQKVEMTSDGLEGKLYTGVVTQINPSASAESTTMGSETVVPIEISVDNPDGVLKPGYTLDLEIVSVDKPDTLTVSASSVKKDAEKDEYYVYTLGTDRKINRTTVEVGVFGETSVEILSGLNENDEIISTVFDNMSDGMTFEEVMSLAPQTEKKEKEDNEESGVMQQFGMGQGGMGGGPGGGMGGRPGGMR